MLSRKNQHLFLHQENSLDPRIKIKCENYEKIVLVSFYFNQQFNILSVDIHR